MWLLTWINFFSNFNEEELDKFELFCQERFLIKGNYLFKEWDDANSMYILATWKIEVSKNIDGRKIILWDVKAEEIIWEMALYDERWKRTASAMAVVDSKLITILAFSIKQIEQKHPEFIKRIKNIIKERKKKNKDIIW